MKNQKTYVAFLIISFVMFMSFTSYYNFEKRSSSEKVYTQTDRPFYFPGETIWFKSYIVEADNTISSKNDFVNAELISPKGAVVKTIKLSIEQGYAYGDFFLDKDWVGGIYTMKVYTNWMRNFGQESFFTKKITVQKVVKPNLLLKLKFEKEGYGKASNVISNFEVKDLKNNPLRNKKVTFEVTVKGEKILSKKIVTDSEGKANPIFNLPSNLSSTDVVLNVLIPHKGSTESISRSVPVVLDNIDLQFLPESGKIIAKSTNNIAFKALNEFGKPVAIEGVIFDENNKEITKFSSFHDGMGSFQLKAKKDKIYYAKITAPFKSIRKIELPKTHTNGTQFSVTTDSLQTKLKVFSTEKEMLYLEVFNASKKLLNKSIVPTKKEIIVNTKNLPIGVTKFSLRNSNREIVAERLIFINAHKKLNVNISLNKEVYKTREKVNVSIKTTDEHNKPIPSNLSVAIADNKLLSFADDKQDNILSSLLLSSELKGKIHKPSFYFNTKEPKSVLAIDYLMLTHGWRDYFNTPKITLENAAYKPEEKGIQSGTITDKKGNPIKANLLLFNKYGNKVLVFESGEDGKFMFKIELGKQYTLLAYRKDGKKVNILKNQLQPGQYAENISYSNKENNDKVKAFSENKKLLKKVIKEKATANISLKADSDSLDEVVVVGYGSQRKSGLTGALTTVKREDISAMGTNVSQALQGRVAGVRIQENIAPGASPRIVIRGAGSISANSEPLIVVDGVPSDSGILQTLDTNQISEVNVLKDASATAIYGSQAINGVIIITTKSGNQFQNWKKKKINNVKYHNYAVHNFYNNKTSKSYNSRSFYTPKYNSNEIVEERTDFRQTVYWNPVVQTDENGEASFEFYNSDAITSFKITIEGIGYNGLVGRKEKTFATKKMINVAFKAPNYMVLNDTIVLPIVITNESKKNIKSSLELQLPKNLQLLEDYTKDIEVAANKTVIKNIRIVPIEKGEDVLLQVNLKGDNFSDVIKTRATILSPYFPTAISISGTKSENFKFNLNNVVKNSVNADFKIYTDVVGNVMDGIEGLIRKPYGCFEQTSSSTYPNIMVLKYLKESGKSNSEIEKKALKFIKEGYKRLISFETKEGGFEWFGRTPPHETLTAYGILEFTEMKEVYDKVDQKMIDRTVKWLLSRKDGKGGFDRSNKGYDSFASSPSDVANAYIVYALSEAKVNADINFEYETAYNDALKTNDTYKMALLALASHNLNKPAQEAKLMNAIKENIATYGFEKIPVKNTITRSYGASKNIETTAFTLLALMRSSTVNDVQITAGIDYLLSTRKHNTFGATQSTAMALKALIAFTKKEKQKIISNASTVSLTINGEKITRDLTINDEGKIGINGLSEYLKVGEQNIAVNFSNPEVSFPYSFNFTWESYLPNSSKECFLDLKTTLTDKSYKVGDNVSLLVEVKNKKQKKLGMGTAIIGIPSGTTPQPRQLKELLEKEQMAYYEIFDNYLVFYWREFDIAETKEIRLDLKADIAGSYKAPASTVYLYYGDEYKTWVTGSEVSIEN